jgi:hypothetical protein
MDTGHASSGEWIFFIAVLVLFAALVAVLIVEGHRHRNPATGLRLVVKTRRFRGPLKPRP